MTEEEKAAEEYCLRPLHADVLKHAEQSTNLEKTERTLLVIRDIERYAFLAGVKWAREHDNSEAGIMDVIRLRADNAALRAQVANWERQEVSRASCCADNEMRANELEAQLRDLTGGLSVEEFKGTILALQAETEHLNRILSDITEGER